MRKGARRLLVALALVIIGGIAAVSYDAGTLLPRRFGVRIGATHSVGVGDPLLPQLRSLLATAQEFDWQEDNIGARHQVPVAHGDFDGDGVPDLIRADSRMLCWLETSGRERSRRFDSSGICGVGFADIDGDGNLDVWIHDCGDQFLRILWGDGAGGFLGRMSVRVPEDASNVALLDVDGDGDLDMVYSLARGSAVPVQWLEFEPGEG